MIQSVKFDSSKMNIKKLSNIALGFIVKRLIEAFGICVILFGISIIIALISSETTDLTVTLSSTTLLLLTQFYSDIKKT